MRIKKSIVDRLIKHAKKDAPIEACGYLACDKAGVITESYELTNIDKSEEHFSFDPKEQFDAMRKAREKGLTILAVYHSHPRTPARPSGEDIKLAHDPALSYVIVSLREEKADIKSFRIKSKAHPRDVNIPGMWGLEVIVEALEVVSG